MTCNRMIEVSAVLLLTLAAVAAPSVRLDETAEAQRWVATKLQRQTTATDSAGLLVLANNDPVQLNARGGRPLKIADRQFRRGLYCHAVSKVVVKLPSAGKRFSAIIGVDSNEQTNGGHGSVVFSVQAGGKELYHSQTMHEGMPGESVNVDLGGVREFTLLASDGGDGIGWDQSDWADARVELTSGEKLWLGEMPLLDNANKPYSVEPPFSFVYGGKPSAEFLKDWQLIRTSKPLDDARVQHDITYTDKTTGLVLHCVAVEYRDFPTVEWTLYFKNTGTTDTPVLSEVMPLDVQIDRSNQGEFTLHHNTGSPCQAIDYQPLTTVLAPGSEKRISAAGGRPTNSDLPFFNIEWQQQGLIAVIGWPGQWAARFVRDQNDSLRIVGGQELTHFKLHPGEEVRTPLVVLQFWRGDWIHAQNVWREWMRAYGVPHPGGKSLKPQVAACSSHQFGEMIHANEENQKLFIDRYLEERLPLDYWWMDAGWYPNDERYSSWGWPNTGTWEVDTKRFPNGLRAITNHGRSKGVRSIVWFEPERVTPGTWLWQEHQDWLLGPKADAKQDVADTAGPRDKLLDLGNPQAREWLINHVDKLITEQGIDLYRQDFNTDPLDRWRMTDTEDRQGITEIRYVCGYLAYWDELLRRHPGMLIDSCASGGRRNDLETMRRAVPLLRSDYILEPVGQQNHTYGMSLWYPFYGTGMTREGVYEARSCLCPHITCCYDMRDAKYDFDRARRACREWQAVAATMLEGDFYPLTPFSAGNDVWMAWQFNSPKTGEGVVQVFRRGDSMFRAADLRLQGLDPNRAYTITDLDTGTSRTIRGQTLEQTGLPVEIGSCPGSALLTYQLAK